VIAARNPDPQILADADLATYQAKAAGRGRSHYVTEELRDRNAGERLRIETLLRFSRTLR
jgi:predicted signal transduction protein with EAL and GGDEF domain